MVTNQGCLISSLEKGIIFPFPLRRGGPAAYRPILCELGVWASDIIDSDFKSRQDKYKISLLGMVAYLSLLMKPVKSFIEKKRHRCGTAMSAFTV